MRFFNKRPRSMLLALVATALVPAVGGCSGGDVDPGSLPKTEAQKEYESKVQELVKQGKTLDEIRYILRGEDPGKYSKKSRARRGRR